MLNDYVHFHKGCPWFLTMLFCCLNSWCVFILSHTLFSLIIIKRRCYHFFWIAKDAPTNVVTVRHNPQVLPELTVPCNLSHGKMLVLPFYCAFITDFRRQCAVHIVFKCVLWILMCLVKILINLDTCSRCCILIPL